MTLPSHRRLFPPIPKFRGGLLVLAGVWSFAGCGGRSSLDNSYGNSVDTDGTGGETFGPSSGGNASTGGRSGTGGIGHGAGGSEASGGQSTGGSPTGGDGSGGDGSGGDGSGGDGSGGDGSGGDGSGGTSPALWRNSFEYYCNDDTSTQADAPQLWADSRGIFIAEGNTESLIAHNSGDGWTTFWHSSSNVGSPVLSGVVNDSLFFGGRTSCAITEVNATGEAQCSGVPATLNDLHMVSTSDGVAIGGDRVLTYDGVEWTQLGDPLAGTGTVSGRAIWADANIVVAATSQGAFWAARDEAQLSAVNELQDIDLRSAWGHEGELWLGAEDGRLFHFDSMSWSTVTTVDDGCPSIRGIWGTADGLFLHTKHRLYSVAEGTGTIELFGTECNGSKSITSLWGLSSAEVFFATVDYSVDECGGMSVHWFDGNLITTF